MNKLKERLKKGLAMMMAVAVVVSVLLPMPVEAASETAKIVFQYCHDAAGNSIRYQQTVTHDGRVCTEAGNARTRIYADGEPAFCIQPGVSLHTGNTLRANASDTWNALSSSQRSAVNLALLYGSQGSMGSLPSSEDEKVVATQMVIWEIVTGCRNADAPYNRTDSKFYESICANGANGGVSAAYSQIEAGMQGHGTIPSFASTNRNAAARELSWNGDKYVLNLTDTNGVLSKYNFVSSDSGVSVSVLGSTLTIVSTRALTGKVLLSATKKSPTVSGTLVAYGDASLQDVVVGVESAADVTAYLSVDIPYGHLQIAKTSEDGIVAGVGFQIVGNGINKTVMTGSNGTIKVENLNPGIYTVTELADERYETQKVQKVTVAGGQTTRVEFSNILKRGNLKVVKSSEDDLVEGVRFHLYGISLSGAIVNEYATTDRNGVAMFSGILISGTTPYTLEEVNTPVRYVIPEKQRVTIRWKEVSRVTITNILKKFRVNVKKTDMETGEPQGDAALSGAVYGIYAGDTLIDTYATDREGRFTTAYYACGYDWSIREITPSEGYILDETVYHVAAEPENYTIELNAVSNGVLEPVIKGRVSIIKHTDDGSTQIETPEEGAEFQLYLKSSGNYDNAKESERDTLVCDQYGYAETKDLPYGIYTVHQTKGWENRELMKDFYVYISKNGEIYRYLINNSLFESYIKIVKTDAETGKSILLAGAGYQIYDGAGELVTMKYTYPEVTILDTFYTGSEGCLITPEELPYGSYTLVEAQAPYGYVLDSSPIPFIISQENSSDEGSVTVVAVEQRNMPQKGKIRVTKSAEEFAGVQVYGEGIPDESGNLSEGENVYAPVYETDEKESAVYEVIATEDIVTQDGTVRAAAGEVVDTLTTDSNGNAETKELYLGRYKIVEVTAPYGCVLDTEEHKVELSYAGQTIPVMETNVGFCDERQKVLIDLTKALEQDESFGIGNKGEIQNVAFGLYAAENLTASDGSFIPADGLIEIAFCAADGVAVFNSDIPFGSYYVKEVCTDQHYLPSDEKYPVEFSYQGQNTALVSIHADGGEAIGNKLLRGRITGVKVDTKGQALEKAAIGLFSADAKEFDKEKALMLSVSDVAGIFAFEDVAFGNYIVREIESPKGYMLNETLYYVSMTAEGEVIKIKITDKQIVGSVRLKKVDAEYPSNKLAGAIFELYQDTDGNKRFDYEKDSLIAVIPKISDGIYQMDGLLYGGYFVKEKTAPNGYVSDGNAYFFEVNDDGKIVDVENKASIGFINKPIIGKFELTKTDVSDGKPLPNAKFRVKDKDRNFVATGVTDENGIAVFTLRYGEYTCQEYEAPEGYLIDEKEFLFEIKEDGQVVKAAITNERKPVEIITTPKTGDESNVGLWIAVAVLSVAGIGVFGVLAGINRKG